MRVVALVAPERLTIVEREVPRPGPGEVRIAVEYVGICGTDMEFYRGRRSAGYPFVLGHECSGRIDAVGAGGDRGAIGSKATVRPNFGCGVCALCAAGRENICPESRGLGVTIDGCLAEYVIAPERYVWPLPDGMDLEAGCLIEPLAVAERAVRRAGPLANRRLLVLGAGPIGLLTVQVAALAGADVTVVDPVPARCRWAEAHGAARSLDPTELARSEGQYEAVIETAGAAETVSEAIRRAGPGARIVLTGIPMDAASIETRWIVWRELELLGSFIYEREDFARACERIRTGEVRALDLVTHRYAVQDIAEAFAAAAGRRGLKVLVRMKKEEG